MTLIIIIIIIINRHPPERQLPVAVVGHMCQNIGRDRIEICRNLTEIYRDTIGIGRDNYR